jgi:diguanylate cyclase (GGDEF)-like protein
MPSVAAGGAGQRAPAAARSAGGPTTSTPAGPRRLSRLQRLGRIALPSRLGRDPYLLYTLALAPIATAVAVAAQHVNQLISVLVLSATFVGLQAILGLVPGRQRPLTPLGWSFLRLAIALLFVAGLVETSGGASGPLVALFLPVVAAAAALGTVQAIAIGALASVIYLAPELSTIGDSSDIALRGIALAGVTILLTVGARRLVLTLERAGRQLRSAIVAERRHSRQIAGMEAVSRLMVSGGPREELLDGALEVLVERFGYAYVSIYLLDDGLLVLGAQRGYERPIVSFDGTIGIMGRVMGSHQLVFVPDVTIDPDYVAVFDEVKSEICAPLIVDGQFIGVLNVEARERLDSTDRDLVATLADRVATMVALGRDREALAERAAVLRSLHEFTEAVSGTLELEQMGTNMVEAARRVIRSDIVALTVLDRESGTYLVRAATDIEASTLGGEVRPGEGLAGRAIRDRTVVIDDQFTQQQFPVAYREGAAPMAALGAGLPLIRDGVVVGALSIVRRDQTDAFRPIEREAMELLTGHASLALANAFLHAEVAQLAIRDPLTGLYNRRHFDAALDRLLASWRRAEPAQRRPLSAIVFDLDKFGDFNKRYGHQVGDEVLRAFAEILNARFRAADLVARLGGEEFVVVLDGARRDDARRVAEEVRIALAKRNLKSESGGRLEMRVSAGCAEIDEAEPTREQLLRTADVALFMAKRAGRDRVVAA